MSTLNNDSSSTIALITVLYNSQPHLQTFIDSLRLQTDQNFILIFVDNASSDLSVSISKRLTECYGISTKLIRNDRNLGIAEGNNIGIRQARAMGLQHLVLLNNDIRFRPNLLHELRAKAIIPGHKAWTCFSYLGNTQTPWFCGGHLSYWRARGVHWPPAAATRVHLPTPITYAPTCLMYLHESVFDQIGLMDTEYFVYYDDTDFCRRMHDGGITLIYDPHVKFRHYVGGSSGGALSPFFIRLSTRNKFLYIRKHYHGRARFMVEAIALLSKLVQLFNPRRSRHTWQGLRDCFLGR